MKKFFLISSLTISLNLNPVINDYGIVAPVSRESYAGSYKTIHMFGDDHSNLCHPDDNHAQLMKLLEIFERAEKSNKHAYHTLIEASLPLTKYHRPGTDALRDLLPEVKARNFKNSTIEDIEIRYKVSAAGLILTEPCPPAFPKMLKEGHIYHKLATESFPTFDMEKLTLQDVFDEYYSALARAKQQRDSLQDTAAKQVFIEDLELAEKIAAMHLADLTKHIEVDKYIGRHQPLIDFVSDEVRAGDNGLRDGIAGHLVSLFTGLFDLNLFYQILMLEQKPIDKIIVVAGQSHTRNLMRKLKRTQRYKVLEHYFSPNVHYTVKFNPDVKYMEADVQTHYNVPLLICLFSLVEQPNENLPWELKKRRWCPFLRYSIYFNRYNL